MFTTCHDDLSRIRGGRCAAPRETTRPAAVRVVVARNSRRFMGKGLPIDLTFASRTGGIVKPTANVAIDSCRCLSLKHLQRARTNYYTTLGLDRDCTTEQIRSAYRLLAKQLHPDVNGAMPDAKLRMQELNAAHDTLVDPETRRAYDAESGTAERRVRSSAKTTLNEDMHLRIEEFFRGATLEVRVNDPGQPNGPEIYSLIVPPGTAPGARLKISRDDGSKINVRVRARPDHRFKVRDSDLRCELRITSQRAAQGGMEFVIGPTGARLRVDVPRGVARGEVVRIHGEGLPKPRGGRGDMLVRMTYRPEVRITRSSRG
jgi:curved DNA-binding protein